MCITTLIGVLNHQVRCNSLEDNRVIVILITHTFCLLDRHNYVKLPILLLLLLQFIIIIIIIIIIKYSEYFFFFKYTKTHIQTYICKNIYKQ